MAKKKKAEAAESIEQIENMIEQEVDMNPPKALDIQVMEKLGTPPDFFKCQVVGVGDERYRVNVRVFVKSNNTVTMNKIAHSYYLRTKNGRIIGGDEIVKTYVGA